MSIRSITLRWKKSAIIIIAMMLPEIILGAAEERLQAISSVTASDTGGDPELRKSEEIAQLVDARRPYQQMKEQIFLRLRAVRQKLKQSQQQIQYLQNQTLRVAQDYQLDQQLTSKLQDRLANLLLQQRELIQLKDELILQYYEINDELDALTSQIRRLRSDLKYQKRS